MKTNPVLGIHFILGYNFINVQYVIVGPYFVVKANLSVEAP